MSWRVATACVLSLAWADAARAACPTVSHRQLLDVLASGTIDRVVFFATWCAGCKQHVEQADARTLLIGTFDEPGRIEEAVRTLAPSGTRCAVEGGSAAALGIKAVPAEYTYRAGRLRRVRQR